jgi:hypothetical protein
VDLRTIGLIIIFALGAVFFLLRLRHLTQYSKAKKKIQQDRDFFLANFDPSTFTDFDNFSFTSWSFSHVGPFPDKSDGEWVYTIFLAKQDNEDISTIVHEITECTVGRLVERLLLLKRPLYLMRKQGSRFWLSGRRQKYLPEHIIATLSELNDIPKEKLEERIALQDIQSWQLLG